MKWILRFILIIFVILIIVGTITFLNGKKMYEDALSEISLEDKVNQIRSDSDFIKFDNLPKHYVNAVISVEDNRYIEHGAIDIIAIGRAIWTNLTNFELREGGSTITQQVAKNLYFIEESDAATRKIAEILIAFDLEKNYTKGEIFELYVNTIYFGEGYYGIKEACNGYLNIEPSEMTLYDCTMMAGIPNAPSVYAPTVNPDLTRLRQKKVISDMVEHGYLTQTEADKIFRKPGLLLLRGHIFPMSDNQNGYSFLLKNFHSLRDMYVHRFRPKENGLQQNLRMLSPYLYKQ